MPERGAWAVHFQHPDPQCKLADHDVSLGDVSADSAAELLEDGRDGASIGCSVVNRGLDFEVIANESQGGSLLVLFVDLPASASKDAPAQGTIWYQSPGSTGPFTSPTCNFYFSPGTPQGISPGEVWLTFDCPDIAESATNQCEIRPGYALFERCDTSS